MRVPFQRARARAIPTCARTNVCRCPDDTACPSLKGSHHCAAQTLVTTVAGIRPVPTCACLRMRLFVSLHCPNGFHCGARGLSRSHVRVCLSLCGADSGHHASRVRPVPTCACVYRCAAQPVVATLAGVPPIATCNLCDATPSLPLTRVHSRPPPAPRVRTGGDGNTLAEVRAIATHSIYAMRHRHCSHVYTVVPHLCHVYVMPALMRLFSGGIDFIA